MYMDAVLLTNTISISVNYLALDCSWWQCQDGYQELNIWNLIPRGLFSISSKQYHKKLINSFHLVTNLRRRFTHRNSLEKFKMISLRSEKVRKLVLPVLFLVTVQCLVAEGKVYNSNYNYINISAPCKVYVFVIECSNRLLYKDAIDNGNFFLHHMCCVKAVFH